jgi:subtilase family serine protease
MRLRITSSTAALVTFVAAFAGTAPALAVSGPAVSDTVVQQRSTAAAPAAQTGLTPPATPVEFDVGVQLRDPAGALAFEQAVSDPGSPNYRQFLTPAQWEARFSPTQASVEAVGAWLRSQGISVEGVTPDRMTIEASASASAVEKAFGTGLADFRRDGRVLRLATEALKVPAPLADLISGISGVDQQLSRPRVLTGAGARRRAQSSPDSSPIPPPEGFRTASPCSAHYGQKLDRSDPPYGGGFSSPLPYTTCGYTPPQLQGTYGLSTHIAGGVDGSGVTVAVVDAYAASTLVADAREYSERNQPGQVLQAGQLSELLSKSFNERAFCEAEEWSIEQTLDIEAVHATAPGAHILYVGAKNCGTGLNTAVQQVVDGHLAQIITDSWGADGGDVLEPKSARAAFDDVLLMAAGTGIGVQFASGDEGDEFIDFGVSLTGYPESSPYQTSVGGTTLEVGRSDNRTGEFGWSTSESILCTPLAELEGRPGCTSGRLEKWLPAAPGEYLYGSGGGTSYSYPEPWYQEGVVPVALARRNTPVTGIRNRVEPDISMDADPSTGMLVGETQRFPDGVYYDQYRIGGTSLSSPLFAGVMADVDQAAGGALGFVNPLLYRLAASPTAARSLADVVSGGKQAAARLDYVNGIDEEEGLEHEVRVIEYEGREEFCEGEGRGGCSRQKVTLSTAPGFDSMTGLGAPGRGFVAALAKP